jgi:hypothetical protein
MAKKAKKRKNSFSIFPAVAKSEKKGQLKQTASVAPQT